MQITKTCLLKGVYFTKHRGNMWLPDSAPLQDLRTYIHYPVSVQPRPLSLRLTVSE